MTLRRSLLRIVASLASALCSHAWATATLEVLGLPTAVIADGLSAVAVRCRITKGYPSNVYAVKATFSSGELPYFGLTYNEARTAWVPQIGSWDIQQPRISTDAEGRWEGFILARLEPAGPRGASYFRFSAIPQSPISNPGPTVSPWMPIQALSPAPPSGGGWLHGHVYLDAACTQPADGLLLYAWAGPIGDLALAGSWLCQNTLVADGDDHADTGAFRIGMAAGTVRHLTARRRAVSEAVPVYTRLAPPWSVRPGENTSVDRVRGDVNGSGAFGPDDVSAAARIVAGIDGRNSIDCRTADIWPFPPDGLVTLQDVLRLAKLLPR